MSNDSYTLHKARDAESVGEMGIDPHDIRSHVLQQFTITGKALVGFMRELRTLRELSAEMSQFEAEGYLEGDWGTQMWDASKRVQRATRAFVREWNALSEV